MDSAEEVAAKYLAYMGYSQVVHEPEPNSSPDILVDGRIAIEVRRLDQASVHGDQASSLEQVAAPLREIFSEILPSFGSPTAGQSWFVFYDLERPLEEWKPLKAILRQILENFARAPSDAAGRIAVCNGLNVQFYPASKTHKTFYVLGGNTDGDAGGWVIPEMVDNLKRCIAEKTAKLAKVRLKYPEWWLVLVNRIDPGLDAEDRKQIQARVPRQQDWAKVIVVNSNDHTRAFEL
jgi:hypothetical protein